MKSLEEIIAGQIWATDPMDFAAEANSGTPYQNDADTLCEISALAEGYYKPEIDKLKKSLEYNAMLSARFMLALVNISQMTGKVTLAQAYSNLFDAINLAKEALITPSFETADQ